MSMVKCILLKIIMWIVIRIDKRLTFSIHIFDEMEHITPDYFHSLTFFCLVISHIILVVRFLSYH